MAKQNNTSGQSLTKKRENIADVQAQGDIVDNQLYTDVCILIETTRQRVATTVLRILMSVEDALKRAFYMEMCRLEHWDTLKFFAFCFLSRRDCSSVEKASPFPPPASRRDATNICKRLHPYRMLREEGICAFYRATIPTGYNSIHTPPYPVRDLSSVEIEILQQFPHAVRYANNKYLANKEQAIFVKYSNFYTAKLN